MRRKRILILVFLLGMVVVSLLGSFDSFYYEDDYYEAVNQKVFLENPLKDGEYTWSYFMEAQDKVDQKVEQIVQDIVSGDVSFLDENERWKIQRIFDKALDIESRNQAGMEEIYAYLDEVWEANSVEKLIEVILLIENELGVDILSKVVVSPDYQDNRRNIIYFYPVTFAFGVSSEYMIDPDYMTYKAYLKRACVQIWQAYGYNIKQSRKIVNEIFSFYEQVSNHSKLASDLTDVKSYYQLVTQEEFLNVYSVLGKKYLVGKEIQDRDRYSLVDQSQYLYLNSSLKFENLTLWKEIVVMKVLASYAKYGTGEYVKIFQNLEQSLLGIEEEKTDIEEACELVKELFSSEIDRVYERKFSNQGAVESIQNMVLEIKEVYQEKLDKNEWLDKSTIEKAKMKLNKMAVVIGQKNSFDELEFARQLQIGNESFLSDVIKIRKLERKHSLESLRNNDTSIEVSQVMVNAYYYPITNSIIIPIAFFELLDGERDDYERLGSLGMILAHEMTHGFDGNGSQFDEVGNLNSWWTEQDKAKFEKLKNEVSSYYSKYEVMPGYYVDGEMTVNENIADLGAVDCIVEVAKKRKASKDDVRKMFTSFASLWASQESEEYLKLLLLQDTHAPNKYRVNAVLSSVDQFYQVYGVHFWNKMYLRKNERIHVW